ncbi:MAG: alpha/beta hydrolase [Melioribacteraceae bacterium]|nr:MAG: alpha/beta hydrolase [Melioribacteraceae bacterium]
MNYKGTRFSIIIFIYLYITVDLNCQDKTYTWKNITTENVYSRFVQDSFKIDIKLPDSYYDSSKVYSLLIVLDGDLLFPIAVGVTQYLEYGNHIPEMIILGIGYGAFEWFNGNNRNRDYTAHQTEGRPYEGGASKFLSFIKEELIPVLLSRFRIDKNNISLMGHSSGAQFVINAFINEPKLFSKFIASSPNISQWQEYFWESLEKNKTKLNASQSKIFISAGEYEDNEIYLKPIKTLITKLNNSIGSNQQLIFQIIKKGEHFTMPSIALTYGLVELFAYKNN